VALRVALSAAAAAVRERPAAAALALWPGRGGRRWNEVGAGARRRRWPASCARSGACRMGPRQGAPRGQPGPMAYGCTGRALW